MQSTRDGYHTSDGGDCDASVSLVFCALGVETGYCFAVFRGGCESQKFSFEANVLAKGMPGAPHAIHKSVTWCEVIGKHQ